MQARMKNPAMILPDAMQALLALGASAEKAGISYEGVIQRITNLGLRWQPESFA